MHLHASIQWMFKADVFSLYMFWMENVTFDKVIFHK
jgi:hypothetical protein